MISHLHLYGAREADRITAIDDRIRRRLQPDTVEQLDAEAQRIFDLYGTSPRTKADRGEAGPQTAGRRGVRNRVQATA